MSIVNVARSEGARGTAGKREIEICCVAEIELREKLSQMKSSLSNVVSI